MAPSATARIAPNLSRRWAIPRMEPRLSPTATFAVHRPAFTSPVAALFAVRSRWPANGTGLPSDSSGTQIAVAVVQCAGVRSR